MGRTATGTLGRQAEQSAFAYLRRRGLQSVARNFRSRGGEIDLIMLDNDCLAFIEVRCRTSKHFTKPSHTVDHRKQQKLIRTAALFIARHKKFAAATVRFDVVAVLGLVDPEIEWIRDAFRPNSSMM